MHAATMIQKLGADQAAFTEFPQACTRTQRRRLFPIILILGASYLFVGQF